MSRSYTFDKKMRLIGYYNRPNQTMHQESNFVEDAEYLAVLMKKSFDSLRKKEEIDPVFKSILNGKTVFILKDEDNNLFAYYPCKDIARISKVVYDRRAVVQMPFEYKSWFTPGDEIVTKAIKDEQHKRYYISTPGSDFLITDKKTKKTLPLDWGDSYISIKDLSSLINDEWVTLYEYDTGDDCGDCDGYDYSDCDYSRCKNDCERCGGRRYVCNDSCFNHRYKKALKIKFNNAIAEKQLDDLLNIIDIIIQPVTRDTLLFTQYQDTLTKAQKRCEFISTYHNTTDTIIEEYLSRINICAKIIDGRETFNEKDSITIHINGSKDICVNKSDVKWGTKGILFWKTHHLQSTNGTYNRITDSIMEFHYEIVFDKEEIKDVFKNSFHRISAIHLKSADGCYIVDQISFK